MEKMSHLPEERLNKLEKIRALGIDPFGGRYDGTRPLAEVAASFREDAEVPAKSAGRITAMRKHGKTAFLDLRDQTGRLQVYLRQNDLGPEVFERLDLLDLGDIIGAEGKLFKTRTGEVTVHAEKFEILTKALLPLPEKWHGLRDVELRYRQRYLDLISNPEVMGTFLTRTKIIARIRSFLTERGFLEVETPMMQPQAGGAAARPFITHHNALNIDLFLRIAPELYLKRLLVGGMEKVFEINRNFRNEGIDIRHNPEFTMMEVYQAYGDYRAMMDLTEELIGGLITELALGETIAYDGRTVRLTRPWRRATYRELFETHVGVPLQDREAVVRRAKELNLETADEGHFDVASELFETLVEPTLVDPTFVIDYPTALCPLTKARRDDPAYAERFELYIASMELANAYTELNDPLEQRKRFRKQLELAVTDMGELDEDFLTALEHGMPPAGGLGIGIDRLVMVLTGRRSIRDVILFPLLRPTRHEAADENLPEGQQKAQ